jgi:sarcosine oxidase subunit beta
MEGLIHAFGFSAHGFALVPVIGPLVADMVEARAPEYAIEPFSPLRFDKAANAGLICSKHGGAVV